ncbi:MAG: glycosyltransferase family 2 protein [Caldilineaceae bacterium]
MQPTTAGSRHVNLSIIIVSWNVWPLLRACLQSIAQLTTPAPLALSQLRLYGPANDYAVEVIVVDNASSDETITTLPALFPWVHLVPSQHNLGFTAGNNLGYKVSRGEFVFFLNPDTELTFTVADEAPPCSPLNPLTLMHTLLQDDVTIGMVGPQLRYGDGSWQNSRRHFPTRWTGFFESTWLGQFWPNNPWVRHMHMREVPATTRHEVDWLNGSAMYCRREALETIRLAEDHGRYTGPFDERFFMYSEELDLCQRIKAAGWRICYLPEVTVKHYEGQSSGQVVTRRHILFNTSKVRYYQKYFGTSWAIVLRAYLLFEYGVQVILETGKLLLGHKPALRRARIQGYLTILRSGFRDGLSLHA